MHETTTHTAPADVRLPDSRPRSYTDRDDIRGGTVTQAPADSAVRSRESLSRAERIQIAFLAGLFVLMAATISAGAIAFTTITGQLLEMQRQMHEDNRALREEIGDLRIEMHEEIGGLREEMHQEIGGLREEMHQEIGGLREEIVELSDRITRIETFLQIHHGPLPGP